MKILKIELQNINSLKSETPIVIDFEDSKFQDIGLYAITGVTGAGKTTILDAITIALYQEVPRFNKSNIKAGLIDVVSYGATEALSRVTFFNKNIRYEAQWSIRLVGKSGKKLNKPDENVRLKNLDSEEIIAEKKLEFKTSIERITQLTYKQFLRSVLLAQGEFAAFLSANAKEKGTLLEQITGEEIYKKIGEAIGARKGEETKKLETLKAKINNEDLLSEIQRSELQKEQKTITAEISELIPKNKQLEKIENWYVKEENQQKEKIQLTTDFEILEKTKIAQQSNIQLLKLHEKARPFKEQVELIKESEKQQQQKKEIYQKLTAVQSEQSTQLEITKKQAQQYNERYIQKEKEQTNWLPKLDMVTKLDTHIQTVNQQKDNRVQTLKQQVEVIAELKKSIIKKEKEVIQLQEKKERLKDYLITHKSTLLLEKEITIWNTQLTLRENKSEQLHELSQGITQKVETLEKLKNTIAQKKQTLDVENRSITILVNELQIIEDAITKNNLNAALITQEQLKKQQETFVNALRIANAYQADSKIKNTLNKEKVRLKNTNSSLQTNLEVLKPQIAKATQAINDAEKILDLERSVKSYEEERTKLIADQACPLCGSEAHPYVDDYTPIQLSKSEKVVTDRKKTFLDLQEKIKRIEIQLAQTTISLKNTTDQAQNIRVKIDQHYNDFKLLQTNIVIENVGQLETSLSTLMVQLKKIETEIAEAQNLQKQKEIKTTTLNSEKEKIIQLQQEIAAFEEKYKNKTQELTERKTDQHKIKEALLRIEENLKDSLIVHQLQLPFLKNSTQFIENLKGRINEYKQKEKQVALSESELAQLLLKTQNESKQLSNQVNENEQLQKEITQFATQLQENIAQRKEILPLEITTEQKRGKLQNEIDKIKKEVEKAVLVVQKQQQKQAATQKEYELVNIDISNLNNKIQKNSDLLKKALTLTEFSSKIEIEKALLNDDEVEKYQSIRRRLEDRGLELKTKKEQWETTNIKQKQEKNFENTLEEVKKEKQELGEIQENLHKKTGSIQQKIILDNQIRERNKILIVKIEEQEKTVIKWVTLFKLIGGSKDAFNTYVQRLTLQNLIHLANRYLYNLNKRYSLQMKKDYGLGEELNFMLVDHYQANETRLVDTSSGGEKFLISLSLALGLSDLASHNVAINSLFIDEGFGTLDNNSLETVIAALETLQAQGKMIGIISHVENLKERISTQIQVVKKNNGVSEVAIMQV